jgi:hypothetical protein
MGLFDRLFGPGDPAAKWVRDPELKLDVNLEAGTLCGVRLGLQPESLSPLGRPTNREATRDGIYTWAPLGLQAVATRGILTSYLVAFKVDDLGLEARPFPGTFLLEGKPAGLGASSGAEEVLRLLGTPWHRFADPEDEGASLAFFYELRGLEWEVEILPSGTLGSIALHSPPSLGRP